MLPHSYFDGVIAKVAVADFKRSQSLSFDVKYLYTTYFLFNLSLN